LNPSSVYAMEFAVHCYEAYAFLTFKKLITLYLGGPENALRLMGTYPPKKIWAAFPLCCCWVFCYPCIPHVHLTPSTFRRIYLGVYQFIVLGPTLSFIEVIKGYQGSEDTRFETTIRSIRLASIVMCMYSLFVYMKAASEPLLEYRTRGKFWAMKITVIFASFLSTIISFPDIIKGEGGPYSQEVMVAAWSACLTIFFMVPLAWFMRRVFTVEDCDLSRPVFMSEDLTYGAVALHGNSQLYDPDVANMTSSTRKDSENCPPGRVSISIKRSVDDS